MRACFYRGQLGRKVAKRLRIEKAERERREREERERKEREEREKREREAEEARLQEIKLEEEKKKVIHICLCLKVSLYLIGVF